MKCRHCGKKYEDSFSYCPYCAEPKPLKTKQLTIKEAVEYKNKNILLEGFYYFLAGSVVMMLLNFIIAHIYECLLYLFSPIEGPTVVDVARDMAKMEEVHQKVWGGKNVLILLLCSVGVAFLFAVMRVISWKFKSKRKKIISIQFESDQKSICPVCGSHSVALGRKGYDWNQGFRYEVLNIKGGQYLAGMDSRRVTAHCQNCGHSWVTDEEWIV